MKKYTSILIVLLGISCLSFGKSKKISSVRKLDKYLMDEELVVVLFYDSKVGDHHEKRKIKNMKKNFKNLDDDYHKLKESDVLFLYIDLHKDRDGEFKDYYDVSLDLPIMQLYKDGKFYTEGSNKGVISGIFSQSEMNDFIMENFEDFIDEIIKEKDEEREREIEKQKLNRSYWYNDYYYDYPWYYRRWPYHSGYHRRKWRKSRPGFHFGVSI